MKYHNLFFFFQKLGKMSQNLSSTAVVIGALRLSEYKTKKNEKYPPSMQRVRFELRIRNQETFSIILSCMCMVLICCI